MLGRSIVLSNVRSLKRDYLIHKKYEKAKISHRGDTLKNIVKQVAKEVKESQETVINAHKFGRAIDRLHKSGLDKNKLLHGKVELYNRNSIILLAKLESRIRKKAIKYINNGESVEYTLILILPNPTRKEILIPFGALSKKEKIKVLILVGDGKRTFNLAGKSRLTKIPKKLLRELKSEPISEMPHVLMLPFIKKDYDYIIETFNMIYKNHKDHPKSLYEICRFYRKNHDKEA